MMIAELLTRLARARPPTSFPNVLLRTHHNDVVRFYDDLLKRKVVVISFMYTRCGGRCPLTVASVRQLQAALGPQAGRDVFLYSITLDPLYDTPAVLNNYAAAVEAGPGWRLLTGSPADIDVVRRHLGFVDPDPAIDADKTQHVALLLFGNDRTNRWVACPALARQERILKLLRRIAR
jgi:protein SCO1/2